MIEVEQPPVVNLAPLHEGKVRTLYPLDDQRLIIVTGDNISAFDVVMNEPIPNKGQILTAMTNFWFSRLADLVSDHRAPYDKAELPDDFRQPYFSGRLTVARRAEMLPLECIVRGYLTGSAWKEYQASGTVHGQALPEGMQESQMFDSVLFTPSTKAETGHDENIGFEEAIDLLGDRALAEQVREKALGIYRILHGHALLRGITVADTKLEFGLVDGELVLADEVGTPDSSRFWPTDKVKVGTTPPSFDKQPLRDYLDSLDWNKQPPPPSLPDDVIESTARRYKDAALRIMTS